MTVKYFQKRPEGAKPESFEFLQWLDKLGALQNIDDQMALTSLAVDDEFGVFDASAGAFRKITAANVAALIGGTSGTYTPTLTNVANLDGSTAYQCQYMRVGSVVTVSGKVDINPTLAATTTQLGISLPVASNFGASEDLGGTAVDLSIAGMGAGIFADSANDRATLYFTSSDINNTTMTFTFTYRII